MEVDVYQIGTIDAGPIFAVAVTGDGTHRELLPYQDYAFLGGHLRFTGRVLGGTPVLVLHHQPGSGLVHEYSGFVPFSFDEAKFVADSLARELGEAQTPKYTAVVAPHENRDALKARIGFTLEMFRADLDKFGKLVNVECSSAS